MIAIKNILTECNTGDGYDDALEVGVAKGFMPDKRHGVRNDHFSREGKAGIECAMPDIGQRGFPRRIEPKFQTRERSTDAEGVLLDTLHGRGDYQRPL
jgi:hypothetical protein